MLGSAALAQLAIAQEPFVFVASSTPTPGGVGAILGPPAKVKIKKRHVLDKTLTRKNFEEIEAFIAAEKALAESKPEPEVTQVDEQLVPKAAPSPPQFDHVASLLQAALQASQFGHGGNIAHIIPSLIFPPAPSPSVPITPPSKFDAMINRFRSTMQSRRGSFEAMMKRYRQR